jgi:hypothetical protein
MRAVHYRYATLPLVPPAGVEPTLANYLLHTGYKSAVLPLNYRGITGGAYWIRTNDPGFCPDAFLAGKCLRPTRPTLQILNLYF